MIGWLAALLIGLVAARRIRRWRTWVSELAASLASSGDSPTPTVPAWTDQQEALLFAARRLIERVEDADAGVRRLADVIEGMVEGVLVIDGEGTVVLANARAARLLDLPRDSEHAGRSLVELSRHPDLHEMVRLVRAEGDWGEPMVQEVSVGTAQTLTLQVTASRLPARADMERWFVLVFHDISSIRRLERVRRDFVANVSHELRTPLAAIGGYTETLLAGAVDDPERARRFLGIIERHSNRLGRLVDDLLTLSDLELGRTQLRRDAQDTAAAVHSCFETLRSKADAAGVSLETAVTDGLPAIDADADRLEQALLNLIDNAIKYTPSGGHVTVAAQAMSAANLPDEPAVSAGESGWVEISVNDTGVGVPAEDLARLTERFYRVDKARSREIGGTGLGLAIVKHIVQAHGGQMSIESTLGRGTTARLFLPVHRSAKSEASADFPKRTVS